MKKGFNIKMSIQRTNFTFNEALTLLRSGHRIRRTLWKEGIFLYMTNKNSVSIVMNSQKFSRDAFYTDEVFASDWEIHETVLDY